MFYFFIILLGLGCINIFYAYLSENTVFQVPEAPAIVGQEGYIINDMLGCPNLNDLQTSLQASVSSAKANDIIGFNDDITAAIDRGCRSLKAGQNGLVINSKGYYFGWTEIRVDDDKAAYWIDNRYVGTMMAPNWDLRRLFWEPSLRFRAAFDRN